MAQVREPLARYTVQITMLAEPSVPERVDALIPRDAKGTRTRTKSDVMRRALEIGLDAMEADPRLVP